MKLRRVCLGVLAACALLAAGCGGPGAGGGGSDEGPIKVGVLADLTGATADVGTPYNEGLLDYVAWRNQNGGIEGRQIEPDSNDYAYKVPTAEELYKRYVSEGAVVVQGWGTSDSEALRGRVAADEMPFMSGSLADLLARPQDSPYTFIPFATYDSQIRAALNWINEDSGGQAEVAMFHIDSPAGREPAAAAQQWIEEKQYGINLVPYPMPQASNFVALIAKAKDQGAQYIIVQHVSTPGAQVAKDLEASGLPMKLVCLSICADEFFIQTAGPAAAEGHIMVNPVTPPSVEKPGHADMKAYLESKGKTLEEQNVHYVQGWYTMHAMAEGIEQVLKDGEELTGANIKAALEEMGPVDTGGVSGPIDFSASSHEGTDASGVFQVQNGRLVEIQAPTSP